MDIEKLLSGKKVVSSGSAATEIETRRAYLKGTLDGIIVFNTTNGKSYTDAKAAVYDTFDLLMKKFPHALDNDILKEAITKLNGLYDTTHQAVPCLEAAISSSLAELDEVDKGIVEMMSASVFPK